VIGARTRAKVVKNKVAAPFRTAEFDILYDQGISFENDLLDQGLVHGVVDKSGSWLSFQGERLGQGRENARAFLRENLDVREKLIAAVRKELGLPPLSANGQKPAPAQKPAEQAAATQKPAQQAAAAGKEKSR
jgi:recombination protein RecA